MLTYCFQKLADTGCLFKGKFGGGDPFLTPFLLVFECRWTEPDKVEQGVSSLVQVVCTHVPPSDSKLSPVSTDFLSVGC